MQREIKFRVWDKEKKVMHSDVQNFGEGGFWRAFSEESFGEILERADIAVMQFTGLKDKAGKEIYEGDIMKDTYYRDNGWKDWKTESKGVIKFVNGAFCVVDKHQLEEMYDILYKRMNPSDSKAAASIEVIGNIFEHPELINK